MKTNKIILAVILSICAGTVNGILGSGGGIIVVVMLVSVMSLSQKSAQATALMIILPLSIASVVVYCVNGSVPWVETAILTGAFTVGGVVGALLLGKIPNNVNKLVFALLLVAGGAKLVLGVLL